MLSNKHHTNSVKLATNIALTKSFMLHINSCLAAVWLSTTQTQAQLQQTDRQTDRQTRPYKITLQMLSVLFVNIIWAQHRV